MLFDDSQGHHWLLMIDKAGYGYLLYQGNLCGLTPNQNLTQCNPTPGNTPGFAQNDPGNVFAFQAPNRICGTGTGPQNVDCDRITSLGFYCNGTGSNATCYVYFWPNDQTPQVGERLTALQFNPGGANVTPPGSPTISTDATTFTQVTGVGTAFARWLIPGDTITANGQTVRVTSVTDNLHITVTPFGSQVPSGTPLTYYGGYLINPARDEAPVPSGTGYAGGSLVITSSSQGSDDALVFAAIASDMSGGGRETAQGVRTPGTLFAYGATPVADQYGVPYLQMLWNSSTNCTSCQTWCLAQFALPTVANGMVYLPTYAIKSVALILDIDLKLSGVNYFFGWTTTISPGQRQL